MTDTTILEVNNISKRYCRELKLSMLYGCIDIIQDSLGINKAKDKLRKKEFWSVNDVSFELNRGQCMGIIGPNGAGKSTLLKILNGIIKPDKGQVKYRGRMGALIEVGAGFHPILTGRENIYINGTILGLSKAEIDKQFDSIVEFSGLEDFLETPVKNYSSGMRVRLGFSIAAHLDPDILLIDEVLAVGDMAFQSKCRDKIENLVNSGTSIIFVSHNMNLVSNVCQEAILLNKGKIVIHGSTSDVIDQHRLLSNKTDSSKEFIGKMGKFITSTELLDINNKPVEMINTGDTIKIRITTKSDSLIEKPIWYAIINTNETAIASIRSDIDNIQFDSFKGTAVTDLILPSFPLMANTYSVNIGFSHRKDNTFAPLHCINDAINIVVSGGQKLGGFLDLEHQWERHD